MWHHHTIGFVVQDIQALQVGFNIISGNAKLYRGKESSMMAPTVGMFEDNCSRLLHRIVPVHEESSSLIVTSLKMGHYDIACSSASFVVAAIFISVMITKLIFDLVATIHRRYTIVGVKVMQVKDSIVLAFEAEFLSPAAKVSIFIQNAAFIVWIAKGQRRMCLSLGVTFWMKRLFDMVRGI